MQVKQWQNHQRKIQKLVKVLIANKIRVMMIITFNKLLPQVMYELSLVVEFYVHQKYTFQISSNFVSSSFWSFSHLWDFCEECEECGFQVDQFSINLCCFMDCLCNFHFIFRTFEFEPCWYYQC